MKKFLFLAFALIVPHGTLRAGLFDSVADRTVSVNYRLEVASGTTATVGTTTNTVVIHLSSTTYNSTAWRHTGTREINISAIRCQIDKVAASTGSLRIGVVNAIDLSSGSVTWFYHKSFEKNASNTGDDYNNADAAYFKTRVENGADQNSDGVTPWLLSSDITSDSTLFQSDVSLGSPVGGTIPGKGDIVMQVTNRDWANILFVNLEILYHTPESR